MIEDGLNSVFDEERVLSGTVTIGVPYEFGNNIIFPLLKKFASQYPEVKFRISYGFTFILNDQLLRGELDFAFLDSFNIARQVRSKKVYDETIVLCTSKKYLKEHGGWSKLKEESLSSYENFDYIDLMEEAPLTTSWFRHHFKNSKFRPRVRTTISEVGGVAKLIGLGMGVGVLPLHLVKKLLKDGQDFTIFKGRLRPLKNSICVGNLEGKTLGLEAETLMDFLINELQTY